ncbi:MAG: UDP-N-acetylglucosamine 2-epimerase [Alicyclobacillus macrosporangiidus]|uniref:MGDG synthase family glycosyltransferase n=1 Tax=Alicyclobacillus macrosporangiidus TaxID=392015 RepID=UPI0026EC7FDF|nr:glycosyltransferase [Alicyclobacillus macrosporangiidus]MCL6598382.1 UDP-N-acetylglucosamine 2-epimerase [Alicyclobacillus macrosporangiidus]
MSRFQRLLILSATYGEGHQQAAYAVRDALAELSPETEVKVVDYIKSIHPVLDSVVRYCYLKSVRFAPALYGWFYKGTSQIPPSSRLQRQLNSLGLEEMEATLGAFRPDVVLSTFPTPAGVVSHLKQMGRTSVPAAIAITDHAIHSQWIHPLTDMYYVGSEHVRRGLLARGIPSESVLVTGIPIRPAFLQTFDRAALREKYGIAPGIPVLLIMGGAYGVMGDLYHVCEQLFQWHHRIQVIIVTGRNRRLKTSLEELLPKAINPVQVYGFVQEIWELMAIADLMLTKAGGLTISEALALQVPMLLYRPIPGQEVQNAKFLVRSGVAVLARNRREIFDHLHDLLIAHPEKRIRMKERALGVRQVHAAERIAENLMELANRDRTRANYSYQ